MKYTSSVYYLKVPIYNFYIHNNFFSIGQMYAKPVWILTGLKPVGEFLRINGIDNNIIMKEIGHASIFLMIIAMVRICRPNLDIGLKDLYRLILDTVNDINIRNNLQFYSPSKGESKILPFLMKFKLIWLIILVCKYKALRRYGF